MMCMTELHGGICHRTSTPHNSVKMNMKEKKKNMSLNSSSTLEVIKANSFISFMKSRRRQFGLNTPPHTLPSIFLYR